MKIEVIATGNELLDGTISDTNTQRLAQSLRPFGLKISKITIVADLAEDISKAVTQAVTRADVVVISGGMGPTSDDITVEVVAKAFGAKLIENKKAKANILRRLKKVRRLPLKPGHLRQALLPKGADALENLEGTAPGIHWKLGNRSLFFLPGVPREYQFILDHSLVPFFKKHSAKVGEYLFVLKVFGLPESQVNDLVHSHQIHSDVTVGFRAHLPEIHIKLLVKGSSEKQAYSKILPLIKSLRKHLGAAIFTEAAESFEEAILRNLLAQKVRVALAESCTGGLAASLLTKVSGSSKVVDRGFVTYSNEAKMELLGVKIESLEKFGAVSEQVAVEMAVGALQKSNADIAVSVTGIAGPSGGTPKKPVGTVWLAVASKKEIRTILLERDLGRELNQKYSAYSALQLLKSAAIQIKKR